MTDEHTFVMPPAWRRARHPRRDRPDVPKAPARDASAPGRARALVDAVRDDIEHILKLPGTAPDIADAARAHLRGEPDPLGAAAVAYVTAPLHELSERSDPPPDRLFTEALVAEHGVPFAARALAEWAGIYVDNPACVNPTGLPIRLGTPERRERLRSMTLRHHDPGEFHVDWWLTRTNLKALRTRLAAAPDDVHAEAVDLVGGARRHPLQKLLAAYLAPTREDWVEDLWARPGEIPFGLSSADWPAFCALGRPGQVCALGRPLLYDCDLEIVATLVDGVGTEAVVPLLAQTLDGPYRHESDRRRATLGFLSVLPLDAAFQALVDRVGEPGVVPVLLTTARRFPVRAMRLLAGSAERRAAEPLSAHVRANPEIAAEVARDLPAAGRGRIRGILEADTRVPPAPAADLPRPLTGPPWIGVREKVAEPVVVEGLTAPGTRAVTWGPGERDKWAADVAAHWHARAEVLDVAGVTATIAAGRHTFPACDAPTLFIMGPEDAGRPLLKGWEPADTWNATREADEWLPVLVARHGADAHDPVLALARRDPARFGRYALPLLSDDIARTMAGWLVRYKAAGRTARAWLRRHGTAAVPALVPDALGEAGPARGAAEAALRLIADRHGPDAVVEAARVHGDEAAAGTGALLAADPLADLPKKVPSVEWANPRALPQILLRDRAWALPDEAAGHVLTMLAMSKPDAPYAGVRIVRDLCDPASLAEFGWALFRWWETYGAPSKENWALTQLALTGDDGTVRRLTPLIRAWPGEGGHAKAVTGLDVLAGIGSETALMHLHSISQRVKFKALKTRAQEKIQELAAELELTSEQLADRLVPDFGLDASGTLTLDYGPRRFVIGFDEVLRPTVADADGTPRKSLPKPGAKDDPDLAAEAHKRFSGLKKDVRTVASDQLARLERAMVTGRRRTVAEFRDHLVAHPLVGHLVRRLVWLADDGDGDGPAFRVAEDGTFADASDDAIVLSDTAHVRVAHPVHLGDEVKAWTELFTDYEILQPFEQLQRTVRALTGEERETGRLARFEGGWVPVGDLLGLVRRGWERGAPMDAGIEREFSHPGPGCGVAIDLDPGISVGDPEDQIFRRVRLVSTRDLDPVTVSEVLADLVHVTSRAEKAT
ncbi:DUF4132 domain-containing protein [Actinomadura algeriensis]|uniref:DUF4132 domain-containing protein n=1 Tax=Actinomadura algeriensis TaxID=1679523 RepID=A0ABR9K350_9ACTN|nr:DUF4132 domain-containing protein [Actinomadura algeriensis]MBE1537274.1 hypothetical protein [Actinomadura algeriensis]